MKKKLAVYAGTFDPLTVGHLWMIERGAAIFDKLVVAIGVNFEKRCMFSLDERLDMLRKSTREFRNIAVDSYPNQLLIAYAQSIGAEFMLRGIRTAGDYEYERTMRYVNSELNPGITTVFLQPPREFVEISSSVVKGLIGPDGWETAVKRYVPDPVFEKLREVVLGKS